MKALYTVGAHVTGGREGQVRSEGLELTLAPPEELGGKKSDGATNPEQLFAAGYGACFLSALSLTARQQKISAREFAVDSSVVLGSEDDGGFGLAVSLDCTLPGVEQQKARELLLAAHQACPYSKATRGNIPVALQLDGQPLT